MGKWHLQAASFLDDHATSTAEKGIVASFTGSIDGCEEANLRQGRPASSIGGVGRVNDAKPQMPLPSLMAV